MEIQEIIKRFSGGGYVCGNISTIEVNKYLQELIELQSTITRQQDLIKRLVEDAESLAEDYCPEDEQNHSKNCPRGLLGKRYAKMNGHECDPCNCGYEAKYKRHTALMKEVKG